MRRILANLRRLEERPLDQYLYLIDLLDRNEHLFYRTVIDNLPALLPVLYTPTVGEACRQFGLIFRRPRGLYVSARDRGRIRELLRNWPQRDVAVVVVTDGERILGLGDLGAHGMGIAIGKLMLYTACGGLSPSRGLPVMLDVGTDNETLRSAPQYIGLPQPRLRGPAYLELVDEFIEAVEEVFPGALIQFEDFGTPNAFALLARYRERARMFNDDIQGTAAVVLAGLLTAGRLTGTPLRAQRVLFVGAGVAVGAADLLTAALLREGLSERKRAAAAGSSTATACWWRPEAGCRPIRCPMPIRTRPSPSCSRPCAPSVRPHWSVSPARPGYSPRRYFGPWARSIPGRSSSRCRTRPSAPSVPRRRRTGSRRGGSSTQAAVRLLR